MFIKAKIDPNIIYSYKTKLIMKQLDVQNSFNFKWGERSTSRVSCKRIMKCPLAEATDKHFCSMGSDRKYTSIFIDLLHHIHHIKRSTGRVSCNRMMKHPLVEETDIHFYSMGSDRKYTSIFIGILHHVYHIYLFSPLSCGMKFPSKVCPFSYENIFLPKDIPFILWT